MDGRRNKRYWNKAGFVTFWVQCQKYKMWGGWKLPFYKEKGCISSDIFLMNHWISFRYFIFFLL